uniref:Uncharacterized protein n=1 Tax=Helianthus annuus TaxID=4232 RepID=A0A251SF56_HELAN
MDIPPIFHSTINSYEYSSSFSVYSVLRRLEKLSPVKASNCHISWYGSWKIAAEDLLVDLITKD